MPRRTSRRSRQQPGGDLFRRAVDNHVRCCDMRHAGVGAPPSMGVSNRRAAFREMSPWCLLVRFRGNRLNQRLRSEGSGEHDD